MKLTLIFFLIGCLHVSANTYAQTVSITGKNLSLRAIFSSIEKQTGLSFFYSYSLIKDKKPLDVDIKGADLEAALREILEGQGLNFYREGKTIFIVKKEEPIKSAELTNVAPGRKVDVQGKVTNERGELLVGATVSIKNQRRGTITDEKGQFVLRNVAMESKLQISYTGYKAIEVTVDGGDPLTIKLPLANNGLDEAQVIAYGATTERLNPGDVSTVKSAEIEKQPVGNVLAALEGLVPGLLISQNSGMPGSSYSVQIRGQNSIVNGNDPFYVIDGVPYTSELLITLNPAGGSPFDVINPNDIESINVLKDADATAIYGSRAANGAILITTKKGKAGKTRLDINVNQGIGKAPLKAHWLNNAQYLAMRREAIANDGDSLTDPNINAPDILSWDTTRHTDWQKLLIGGTAEYTDAQASVSGGNTNTQFLFGADYHRESTVFPFKRSVPRASVHINITNFSADEKFKFTLTANYVVSSSHLPTSDLTTFTNDPPDAPSIYNKDGSLNLVGANWAYLQNPFSFEYQQYTANSSNLVSNANLSYMLVKGLELRTSLGYTNMQSSDIAILPIAAQDPSIPTTGNAGFSTSNIHSWIVEPQASYALYTDFGKLEALVGSTFEQNVSNGQNLLATGFTSDALIENIQAAPTLIVRGNINAVYKYNALFGRINYNYQDKYVLNFNWRRDGSSRFGPANEFHNFGSVGAAYIFSREGFFKRNLSFLSFGKIRGSYGTTGNDQIGDYRYLDLYQSTPIPYQNTGGLVPTSLNNPELAWEETRKLEGGLELGFLKDRLVTHISYYYNRSSNQLVNTPLPTITGFYSVPENLPAIVQNSGWEFVVNTVNIKTKNFSWTTSVNWTIARNKLVAFPNLASSSYAYSLVIGKPLNIAKVYKSLGVDPATGVYEFSDSIGKPTFSPSYLSDRTALIDLNPKFYGGIQNSFTFKGWELNFLFSFRKQMGANYLLSQNNPPGIFGTSQATGVVDRWQKPGDKAPVERFTQSFSSDAYTAYQYAKSSSAYWVDASFIRLSNLALSYQLPASWITKMHLQGLGLYVHCQNLLTITRYKGMDPENQSITALPPLRVITGGIKLAL